MLEIETEPLPQICQQCLGSRNTHTLVRDSAKTACRLCKAPFVTYNWKTGSKQRKITVICLNCARSHDSCQCCVRDIQFFISLAVRDAALRIMYEENGETNDRDAVLEAVAKGYAAPEKRTSAGNQASSVSLAEVVSALPDVLDDMTRPYETTALCVYGIEEDLDSAHLRSYFKSSIRRLEYLPESRLAFFQFDEAPHLASQTALIDGRLLVFAWGDRVSIPVHLQSSVGAVVKAYLQVLRHR